MKSLSDLISFEIVRKRRGIALADCEKEDWIWIAYAKPLLFPFFVCHLVHAYKFHLYLNTAR